MSGVPTSPPLAPEWVALDWGTSNLRAWAIGPDGSVLAEAQSGSGMAGLPSDAFEPVLLDLIGDWLPAASRTPVVACGMVGSRQGWVQADYATVPCPPLPDMPFAVAPSADPRIRVHVLHGLRQDRPADVMRGEETQIAGLLAREPAFAGLACLPGTHSKWAQLADGRVERFKTYLTGELFALLSEHSVVRHAVQSTGTDDAAFVEAVDAALARPAWPSRQLIVTGSPAA